MRQVNALKQRLERKPAPFGTTISPSSTKRFALRSPSASATSGNIGLAVAATSMQLHVFRIAKKMRCNGSRPPSPDIATPGPSESHRPTRLPPAAEEGEVRATSLGSGEANCRRSPDVCAEEALHLLTCGSSRCSCLRGDAIARHQQFETAHVGVVRGKKDANVRGESCDDELSRAKIGKKRSKDAE